MRTFRVFAVITAVLCVCGVVSGQQYQYRGPGLATLDVIAGQHMNAGIVNIWNTGMPLDRYGTDAGNKLLVEVILNDDWAITAAQLYAGKDEIPNKKGTPTIGKFPFKYEFIEPLRATEAASLFYVLDLRDDVNFQWGTKDGAERVINVALHMDLVRLDAYGNLTDEQEGAWAWARDCCAIPFDSSRWGWWLQYQLAHPIKAQFIDAKVHGVGFATQTHWGVTGKYGGFAYFPGETASFWVGNVYLGSGMADWKMSPLDLVGSLPAPPEMELTGDTTDPRAVNMARLIQSLDADGKPRGAIQITPAVRGCLNSAVANLTGDGTIDGDVDFSDATEVEALIDATIALCEGAVDVDPVTLEETPVTLVKVSPEAASDNLWAGLNASGVFRKNISKTEDWGEAKQKEDVMPVYIPALRSDGTPSICCIDETDDEIDDCDPKRCDDPDTSEIELCEGDPGVPYEEWRLDGCDPATDPNYCRCAPVEKDGTFNEACTLTLVECRDVAKPLLVTYLEKIDIHDLEKVTTDFRDDRFSWDVYTAISRDDGTTWKRMNVSRMADLSSFDLEATEDYPVEEPFPGTCGSPYLKVDDNYILVVWESKFCKSGNPRYSINLCDDPATEEVEADDPLTEENECAVYCNGNPDQGTEVCEPDYPYDDDYYVTDIWGVRGQQQSVNYDEVDDVAELGIGEIPYSCLWAARGVIVTAKEKQEGTFASLEVEDDPTTTDIDETKTVEIGDIVWFKPERITSGRRDAYIPVVNSARGAGFAIVWQEDKDGLRPGKGKGPGEGWSGAISNHKTDMWYTFITNADFAVVDANFVPGGPGGGTDSEPTGDASYEDKPGLGRPKALVPFSLPVRISDNDMVNTDTLKVELGSNCVTPVNGTEQVCFPEVVDGSFVPMDPEEIAKEFCGHPEADPATCCNPDDHEGDPNCEDLKGLFGNLTGTKRYGYMAATIDERDNATGLYLPGGDGIPDYQYYMDRGGTLDLCDTTASNTYMDSLPGGNRERWFGFANTEGSSKLVCVTSDGRLLDGDVYSARPMLQLQPYTKPDGSKSAWALIAYEESKGMGHSLAASEHDNEDPDLVGDEIVGVETDDTGQEKPIKQDLGKNMIYHSFDFTQPDLVAPGHIVNLPALCGGLYPTWCDDPKTPDVIETDLENPTCTCTAGQPVPLYFDRQDCTDPTDPSTCTWLPDPTLGLLQYRTEIARRARFLVQSPGKMGDTRTAGAIIFKQGQEGQGRPADVFIRRYVVPTMIDGRKFNPKVDNPYAFENFECTAYLDQTFDLPACPHGAGEKGSDTGYNCNVWGEATGDRLCGGVFTDPDGGYLRRDHINLTSADIDLAVDAGPDDETPEDPTDDRYGTNKVLLWSQHAYNLGDESYGLVTPEGTGCDVLGLVTPGDTTDDVCPAMYSNARSHRGFIRGDLLVTAYSLSPNWAAGRNGNDRYNFYVRRSFDGGQTWTTDPEGSGVYLCPEFRSDPNNPDPDGSGNLPPQVLIDSPSGTCGWYDPAEVPEGELPPTPVGVAMTNYLDPMSATPEGVAAQFIAANTFEPARNISQIKSNHESSGDPRLGATPPTYPLDGRVVVDDSCDGIDVPCALGEVEFTEDTYVDNVFFVAWGTVDNIKSTGSTGVKAEAGPLDIFYTRTETYGDTYLQIPWKIGGENSNQGYEETVWRYDYLAKGEPEEQGECQLRATSDGSKMYAIYHSMISVDDPDEIPTRWYPWKPEESIENDLWFRRVIFWSGDDWQVPVPEEPTEP